MQVISSISQFYDKKMTYLLDPTAIVLEKKFYWKTETKETFALHKQELRGRYVIVKSVQNCGVDFLKHSKFHKPKSENM